MSSTLFDSHNVWTSNSLSFDTQYIGGFIFRRWRWQIEQQLVRWCELIINMAICSPNIATLPIGIQRCMVKYTKCGYHFTANTVFAINSPHLCALSKSCPHTNHDSLNNGGFNWCSIIMFILNILFRRTWSQFYLTVALQNGAWWNTLHLRSKWHWLYSNFFHYWNK
jgi:hypothetical protein